ncbi:MAG: hypothetical protein Q8K85_00590 [Hyphomicrobium sp.]|nr:hypothetical protein [Hyphomicrobium sp.]
MTIVERFNNPAALLAALAAGFVLLAAPANAGGRAHQSMAAVSSRVANSPPIIGGKPGRNDRDHRGRHRHGFIFDHAQANYWLIDNGCKLRRVRIDRYTDAVIIRRGKPCVVTGDQIVTVPVY